MEQLENIHTSAIDEITKSAAWKSHLVGLAKGALMNRERIANRLIAGSAATVGALSYGVSSVVTFASRSEFNAAMQSSTERSCPAMLEVRRFLKMRDRICRSLRTFRISALPVGCEWPMCGSRNSGKAKQAMVRAAIPCLGRSEASHAINDFSHAEYVFEKGLPCFQGIALHFFLFFFSLFAILQGLLSPIRFTLRGLRNV
jgi:hypothetical protein